MALFRNIKFISLLSAPLLYILGASSSFAVNYGAAYDTWKEDEGFEEREAETIRTELIVMKYFGWSLQELQALPLSHYTEAIKLMNEEAQRIEEARHAR